MCLYIILTAHSAAQGCLLHMIHSGIKSKACSQTDMLEKDLLCFPSPVVMCLFVSFGDKALQVVLNTKGCHLLLLPLDLLLLTRQATKFSVLILSPILRVIRNKITTQQHLYWDTVGAGGAGGGPCYKEFLSPIS